MKVDLHMHSIYSDGILTPAALVDLAAAAGLECIALSDHDTVMGVAEARARAEVIKIRFVPSIELSSFDKNDIHILGFNIDFESKKLLEQIAILQNSRTQRNQEIVKKLQKGGFKIEYAEVLASGKNSISRLHIAKVLLKNGYFRDLGEAMSVMREGQPFYVPHFELDPRSAIELIRQSGGKPVLAHPGLIPMEACERNGFVKYLTDCGLCGIETVYKKHTKNVTNEWRQLAKKYGLFESVGGDNHGDSKEGFFPNEASSRLLDELGII